MAEKCSKTANVIPLFDELVSRYENSADHNDSLFRQMTEWTEAEPYLRSHRRYVEQNKLGFGDAAFHAMWLRLLDNAHRRFGTVRALEIGVFKGQVISLWALIGKQSNIDIQISAITPLEGRPRPHPGILSWLRSRLDLKFREEIHNGNFYAKDEYRRIIGSLFEHFDVNFNAVNLYQGYSTQQSIQNDLASSTFHVVYVDGDHTFDGATHDFKAFGPKVVMGGWLVADDAGCSLPGTVFWKGHEAVSRAAQIIPQLGFRNVINVGHNRVYERIL
jgi:Methyltransferase domain